ncbi:uncharacterized protein METZ01_LOCUS385533 [marine metagenome]|uniref:Uncharacterized protein n=1 Tax=marine metagenome TaxID=408172 RepID=A0A382UEH9_9ZZZZ
MNIYQFRPTGGLAVENFHIATELIENGPQSQIRLPLKWEWLH